MDRKEETKLVKAALAKAGINATVEHGHGTAWGWLEINVGSSDQFGEHVKDQYQSHANCPPCKKMRAIAEKAENIALDVTGRRGQYRAEILVLTQKGWNRKLKQSFEIIQSV